MTVNDAIVAATARLRDHSDSPALDAQVLMAHVLDQNRAYVIAHARDDLDTSVQEKYEQVIDQRATGTPVAYITGTQEFWSLPLQVTSDTLIPRPETELLVELAIERIPSDGALTIADIGTGSGAIALAIAAERPKCQLLATDPSAAALMVAKANAERLGIPNIEFREGNGMEPLSNMKLDLIVSNPPYIPEADPHLTQGDVRFEPRSALAAGEDGLEVIRILVKEAGNHLIAGGWLMIEHGYDQEQAVADLFVRAGFQFIDCYRDLAGLPRVTVGRLLADKS